MLEPDPNRYDPNTVEGTCAEASRSARNTLAYMDKAAYPKRAEALRRAAPLLDAAPRLLAALKNIVKCEKRRVADLRHRKAWELVKFSEDRMAVAEAAIAAAEGGA